MIEINQWQPGSERCEKIGNRRVREQGSISNLFQSGLPPDNGPVLLLEKALHS
jgi:hypothetical protein